MRRGVRVLAVCVGFALGFWLAVPRSVGADLVGNTQATLSCSDGHSMPMSLAPTALTNLLAEVEALNSSGTSSCTVATNSSTETTKWTVYDYNPSNRAIAPRNSPNSSPATTTGDVTTFQFEPSVYTALLTTTDPALDGNLSTSTLNDTVHVSGSATTFMSQNGDGCTAPASVRFYFTSPSASGSGVGTPPAGFYTKFWWSNPIDVSLLTGNQPDMSISADMSNPAEWSDWNGQSATNPAVTEAFLEATQKVQSIGLSFGGGCFFENGVTAVNPPESFSSTFTES